MPFTVGKDAQWPQTARLLYDPGEPLTYTAGDPYSSVAFNHLNLMFRHLSLVFRNVTGEEASKYLKSAIQNRISVGRTAYRLTSEWATPGTPRPGTRS